MSAWGTGTMNRPPSGGGGYRPGSQGVPQSSAMRRGTSYGQQAGVGGSLAANVEVHSRPAVMREGMKSSGAPTTSYGPGRQVVDRSYYMGLLRPKVTELTAEIERLRQTEDQITKNSGVVSQMQQKQKTLLEEIGKLKGSLSDVNFAVEQSTSGDPDAIANNAHALKQQNAESRRSVDKLFLQVKDAQSQSKQVQTQLEQEMAQLDERLRQTDQRLYAQYKAARDEAYRTADQVLNMQQEIRAQDAKQDALLMSLGKDPDKKKASAIVLDILKKRQQRDEMARECSVSLEEEKKQLVTQAKTTAQDMDVLQRQIVEAKDAIADSKNQLAALDEDLNEYSGDNARKFQELQEKDREMTEFRDTFKEREQDELNKIGEIERVINVLLEHISRQQQMKKQMPNENAALHMDQMAQELGDKEQQLDAAKKTYERLQKQLAERKQELENVGQIDRKISTELETISHRMQEQQGDITKFADLDGLRREIDARKQHLLQTRTALTTQRDAAKQHLHLLTTSFEKTKQQLNENQVYTSLQAQEQKLRLIWQSAFSVEDFVRSKEKESQFMGMKADSLRMVDEINVMLRDPKRLDVQSVTIAGAPK